MELSKAELAGRIAFNDPRRFVTADGNFQPITNWTEEMAATVASIELVRRSVGRWRQAHAGVPRRHTGADEVGAFSNPISEK